MGMEFRPYYFAKEWIKLGHNVRIIAATFSHLRKKNPSVENDFEIENIDGIEYQWIKTYDYKGNGVKRLLTMRQFVSKLKKHAKKICKDFDPNVVITSSTYPLDYYAGKKIAKISKCKYIHEAHDLWPLTLTEIGGMSKINPFVLMLGKAEKKAYKNSDDVVSVLPYSYEHMLTRGLQSKDKFTYIPNGVSLDDWSTTSDLPKEHFELFEELKAEGKFIVEYLGGHALSNYLDILLDTAKKINCDDVAFVLVGKGVEKERLMSRCKEENINNVYFLPPIEKTCVPTALKQADVLFVSAFNSPLYKFGISMNKIYDYMMSSRPILYGINTRNNDVLESKCGLYFTPGDVDSLISAIDEMKCKSNEERNIMGQNGKDWVLKNCEYSVLAKTFLDIIERGNRK